MTERAPWLVLGVGNELLSDDAVGLAAAARLAALALPGLDVEDGGTLGIGLLPLIEDRDGVLVLDAVASAHAQPGTILVLDGDELRVDTSLVTSPHQLGVVQALASSALANRAPARTAVVGMVPHTTELGYGLSPVATAGLPEMVTTARQVLTGWAAEALTDA